jgi:membrane protein implicated in regulation of membrane protease activity
VSRNAKIAAAALGIGLVLWLLTNFWIAVAVMVGLPAAAYLLLDPSQRRRLRRVGRRELGR